MEKNTQLEMAFNFVQYTDRNIFLTGKAGTGKTTFLHDLRRSTPKRMAVVAPTGVAAINAGGVTIHSFFQLPFGPYIPGRDNKTGQYNRFSKDKINLIRSLDLLVIDEISMVRADTLDHIDEVLKRFRDRGRPFGGVQLLMIGDLHQLSPVVKDEDWNMLKDYYPNMYFFSSRALAQALPISVELKHIYRQADHEFIDLLNSVRKNQVDEAVLANLNRRYIPDFHPADDEGYITLTTHNKYAQEINDTRLSEIKEEARVFNAVIRDDFPEYSYPTVAELQIKPGAQVMFVKNDPSRERQYYNGKIGVVVEISNDLIFVKCPDDHSVIAVSPAEWTNIKYDLDPRTKEIKEKVIGTFTQYPLKLAWAITIHKSQGLTFEKAIIDANLAFAHGQVYVALSRCKTFGGMVLRSPISLNSVKTDGTVAEYTRNAGNNEPTAEELAASKIAFQQGLVYELFNFDQVKTCLYRLNKIYEDHHSSLNAEFIDELNKLKAAGSKEVFEVAETFKRQLAHLLTDDSLPEENQQLQGRIKKACTYFTEKITTVISAGLNSLNTETDNKAVGSALDSISDDLNKEISVKQALMKLCSEGFSTISYLQAKANAEIDYSSAGHGKTESRKPVSGSIEHPELYQSLKSWRDALADESSVPVYMVLSRKSMSELIRILPSTLAELETIKGIGKIKVKQYGQDILEIINAYCSGKDIERQVQPVIIKEKKSRPDTKKISLDLFKDGKTIADIASERELTYSTIESHLAYYINTGEISVFDLVSKIKVAKIMAYILQHPGNSLGQTKLGLGDDFSFSEIKAVSNHIVFIRHGENQDTSPLS